MRIGDVAKRAGIPASTLRYYEDIGLIPPPARVSGQRDYGGDIFEVLDLIRLTQKAGFSLNEIHQLLHDRDGDVPLSAGWRPIAERKLAEVQQTIQAYQAQLTMLEASLDCECSGVHDCQMVC
jgi:MerR family redox-sensitive transcriptional activator SoxR